jgi:LmbE family N-acetylglucosaminyl deacetylase
MLNLSFNKHNNSLNKILCLGAHSDDLEIGCGGSILRILKEYENLEVLWIVFSANHQRAREAENSANQFLVGAKKKEVRIEKFRDGFFPYDGKLIKEYFEVLKNEYEPDLIFTPFREDLHQDHRLVSELTWNTFRNNFILEYEIIKYDGDLGRPNFFIKLSEEICSKKIDIITKAFISQADRSWFTPDAFSAILRLRGIEINAGENFAEAFYGRKVPF